MIDMPKDSKRESVLSAPPLPPPEPSSPVSSPSGPSTSHVVQVNTEPVPLHATVSAAPPAYTMLPHGNGTDQQQRPGTGQGSGSTPRTRGRSNDDEDDEDEDDKSSAHSPREHSAGRAFSKGMLVILSAPVFVAGAGLAGVLAVLYGAGKLIEGIGKGLSMGPEAAYRKYQAREERKMERKAAKRAARRKSQSRA
ncbi:hypothetical protein BV20DRAFT_636396 [Pilatotrama ljubarskyi]|nr:hypothetical protein BV20DRAFT_636396 [Pilatotrama ljubarskyi]